MHTTSRGSGLLAATLRMRVTNPRITPPPPFSSLALVQCSQSRHLFCSTSVLQKHPSLAESNGPKDTRSFSTVSSTREQYDGMSALIRSTFDMT